MSIPTKSN